VNNVLEKSEIGMKRKGTFLFIAFVLGFLALIGQLTYIVFVEGKNYNLAVLQNVAQREGSVTLNDKRGKIIDRNGIVFAESVATYDLIFDARLLSTQEEETVEKTIQYLNSHLAFSKNELKQKLINNSNNSYDIIGKGYSYTEFKQIKEDIDTYQVIGIFYREHYERNYPYPTIASDIVGFVNNDFSGAYGIELIYDEYLKGDPGRVYGSVGDDNMVEVNEVPAVNGDDVMLTIDYTIQKHIKDAIKNFREDMDATFIQVIVMNPNTGEIYGMVNDPDFSLEEPYDLTAFYDSEVLEEMTQEEKSAALNNLWKNEAITNAYEPGSTFKPFVFAAGLEEQKTTLEQTYECKGHLKVADRRISCWKPEGHGIQTIAEGLENSCNVAFMLLGEQLGRDLFYKYQHMFGFGSITNIDLNGETSARNLIHKVENLNQVELATSAFGQTFGITPIQLITGFSSLINGGKLYEPHLMKSVFNESQIVETHQPKLVRQVVSEEVAEITKQALAGVVNEGTGKKASIAGYEIGGKTGTAETLGRDDKHYIVSFIGFAPIENPEVITLVVVDEPQASVIDSRFAASIFVDVMEDVMPYLHIFKDVDEEIDLSE
jgi:stage V sporulation protein D (sporulation-specific penicillin-binding protein)